MSLHDISLKLAGDTVRWVTAPPFELEERRRMSKGDLNNSSVLNMSVHSAPTSMLPSTSSPKDLPSTSYPWTAS